MGKAPKQLYDDLKTYKIDLAMYYNIYFRIENEINKRADPGPLQRFQRDCNRNIKLLSERITQVEKCILF